MGANANLDTIFPHNSYGTLFFSTNASPAECIMMFKIRDMGKDVIDHKNRKSLSLFPSFYSFENIQKVGVFKLYRVIIEVGHFDDTLVSSRQILGCSLYLSQVDT